HAALQAAEAAIARASDTLKSVRHMVQRKLVEGKATSLTRLVEDLVHLLPRSPPLEYQIEAHADRIFADKMQVEQVLLNLIRNACEAIEGRSDGKIVLEARRVGNMATVCVADNGPGVPAEAHEHLFSPFKSNKPDGLGIGLSICRTIVEQHQGLIWLASSSSGARFCFTIPVAQDDNPSG
ncbi:MAG: sensor histidine kinase, partial [Sphingosinicella sp.]|uniref:sensor histidine kinase n=1 Tax=Sphingosinicella sp. TaxID=1917971 RepID=UPI004037D06B